ncbi:hypothetical protein G3V96_29995, partial [Escherichia coli]|nr:hypothetical protein [Escherichia coli]
MTIDVEVVMPLMFLGVTAEELAKVATTGDYNDLTNKPVIPNSPDDIGAQPAVEGMGLSANDFTDEEKSKLAALQPFNPAPVLEALERKVDKVPGKALSSNDFTSVEKTKLAGLQNYDDAALRVSID